MRIRHANKTSTIIRIADNERKWKTTQRNVSTGKFNSLKNRRLYDSSYKTCVNKVCTSNANQ